MAVPGPVTSSRSTGTNKLIRDGEAILVRDADDVRGIVGELAPRTGETSRAQLAD